MIANDGAASATLTINRAATVAARMSGPARWKMLMPVSSAVLFGLLVSFRRRRAALFAALVTLALVAGFTRCGRGAASGGNSSENGSTAPSYSAIVTATSGGIQHSTTIAIALR